MYYSQWFWEVNSLESVLPEAVVSSGALVVVVGVSVFAGLSHVVVVGMSVFAGLFDAVFVCCLTLSALDDVNLKTWQI